MNEVPSLLPVDNGAVHPFVVRYVGADGREQTHPIESKSVRNALASFTRAVPRHGRILGIRKVVEA